MTTTLSSSYKLGAIPAIICLTFLCTGCQTTQGPGGLLKETFASDDPCANNARNIGMTVGVIAGTAIGWQVDKRAGAVLGAGLGALIGGLIGNDIDHRRCELHRLAQANHLEMTMSDISISNSPSGQNGSSSNQESQKIGLSVSISDQGAQFESGSSQLTLRATQLFEKIADQYKLQVSPASSDEQKKLREARNQQIRILLVGHTDDTGSSQLNADLSEARAKSVAKIFATRGISANQIYYQGAGETLPISDNSTEQGRAKNRRVEIVDIASESAFAEFLAQRKPNTNFYRNNDQKIAISSNPPTEKTKNQQKNKGIKTNDKRREITAATVPLPNSEARSEAASKITKSSRLESPPRLEKSKKTTSAPVENFTNSLTQIDFGGEPADQNPRQIDIGKAQKSSFLTIISSAYANEKALPIGSCAQDRARKSNAVKSLQDEQIAKIATRDFLPGMNNSSWAGIVNGHYVALTHVAVLRDGVSPVKNPNLLIYSNYKETTASPSYRGQPQVNAYQGENAVLYRVFSEGPVKCIDLVIQNTDHSKAPNSNLIYPKSGKLYQANYSPALPRANY